jgi:hypothetical protein
MPLNAADSSLESAPPSDTNSMLESGPRIVVHPNPHPNLGNGQRVITVQCEPHTVVNSYKNGRVIKSTEYFTLINEVGPSDEYYVESCGERQELQDCSLQQGPELTYINTCTGNSEPPKYRCSVKYREGEFVDGKLYIYCGKLMEISYPDISYVGKQTTVTDTIRVYY